MSVDLEIARGIAEQLRSSGQPRTRRRVTTIMTAYDSHRLTGSLRCRIANSFDEAGLVCEPSMLEVDRSSSLRLSLAEVATDLSREPEFEDGLPKGVHIWKRMESGWVAATTATSRAGVLLVDVDLSQVRDPEALVKPLLDNLRELDEAALHDLLERDTHAAFKRFRSGTAIRASLFVAVPDAGLKNGDEDDSIRTSLGVVEFAVGPGWILVVRHLLQSYVNGSPAETNHPVPSAADYVNALQDYGLADATSPKAAAVAVINHAVDSFGRAREDLASYVESWRNDFNMGSHDKSVLSAVQATLPLLVDALVPFKNPSVKSWVDNGLPGLPLATLSDDISRNLEALRGLSETTAAAIAQANQAKNEQQQADLATLAYADQAQNERYQASLATLAAVLLAPALVSSVFGASNFLSDSPLKLIWLLATMLIAGLLTQQLISRKLHPRHTQAALAAKQAPGI